MTRPSLKRSDLVTSLERRLFLRQGAEPRRIDLADRLRHFRSRRSSRRSELHVALERSRPGASVQSPEAGADLSGKRDRSEFRLQCLFPGRASPQAGRRGLRLECRASSRTSGRGRSMRSMPCRRRVRSRAISASRAGASSGNGAAPGSASSCSGSAPTLPRNYVGFQCADGYYGSIDMPTALHPQTIMAFKFGDEILPTKFGYPIQGADTDQARLKNPKWVTTIYVTNRQPGGFWEDRGYNWFSGS